MNENTPFLKKAGLTYRVEVIREIEELEDVIAVMERKLWILKDHRNTLELSFENADEEFKKYAKAESPEPEGKL